MSSHLCPPAGLACSPAPPRHPAAPPYSPPHRLRLVPPSPLPPRFRSTSAALSRGCRRARPRLAPVFCPLPLLGTLLGGYHGSSLYAYGTTTRAGHPGTLTYAASRHHAGVAGARSSSPAPARPSCSLPPHARAGAACGYRPRPASGAPYTLCAPYAPYAPCDPYSPYTPCDPYAPYAPCTPCDPYAPYTPCDPYAPYTPYAPCTLCAPYAPYAPCDPYASYTSCVPCAPYAPCAVYYPPPYAASPPPRPPPPRCPPPPAGASSSGCPSPFSPPPPPPP
eukprot:1196059-Prorocentrum_minimum.AAC.5